MTPITPRELSAIEQHTSKDHCVRLSHEEFARIAVAVRASFLRPITEAPRDGTFVDVWDEKGNRYPDSSFINGEWCDCEGYVFSVSQQPVSFLPILKVGAS